MIFEDQIPFTEKSQHLSKKEAFRIFIREFNHEAKLQGSKWFAEVQNTEDLREDYHFLHISKHIGWFIFKQKISFHVNYYSSESCPGHFSFVDNDYSLTEYGEEQNQEIFKYLPEFESILKKIPLNFVILKKYGKSDFEASKKDLIQRLENLENFVEKHDK